MGLTHLPWRQAGLEPTKVEFSEKFGKDAARLSFETEQDVIVAVKKLNETEGGSKTAGRKGAHGCPKVANIAQFCSVPTSPVQSSIESIRSFDGVRTNMFAHS